MSHLSQGITHFYIVMVTGEQSHEPWECLQTKKSLILWKDGVAD